MKSNVVGKDVNKSKGKSAGGKRKRKDGGETRGKENGTKKAKTRRMPRDAFQLFCAGRRNSLRKEKPDIAEDKIKIRAVLEGEWEALDVSEKKVFEERAAKSMKEYKVGTVANCVRRRNILRTHF